ncbi:MAG: tol-pal system YbgF family protein, partial [Gemmatimonadales bacterium]
MNKSRVLWTLLLALSLASGAATLRAQETPADTARVLEQIARNLRDSGRTELAEALLELITQRYPGTESARLADSLLGAIRGPGTARAGRNHMIAWSTIYGAWLGVALPLTFDEDPGESAFGAGLLILPPTAFLLAKIFSDNNQVTRAQAAGQTFGSLWGTFQGFGWKDVLDIGRTEQCFFDSFSGQTFCSDNDSETAGFAMGVAGGIAGFAVGHVLARNLDPGTMTAIGHGANWGSWFGAALGILADQEDDALLTWSLMGGNIALVGTA